MLNLRQKLDKLAFISLAISNVTAQKTREGEYIAILELADPIPYVRGSQELNDGVQKIALEAFDVTEIKIHENDIDEAGEAFAFDEDGTSGTYEGKELILDVAKSGQVWLRKDTFASAGTEMRRANGQNRVSELVRKTLERKAQSTGTPTGKLNPVEA